GVRYGSTSREEHSPQGSYGGLLHVCDSGSRKTHTTGGRENGASRSSDGRLDIKLSTPGTAGIGTNPEQLFAAGWSACFEGAMGHAAPKMKITLPADLAIDAEVDLCLTDGACFLQARLNVSVPSLEREVAQTLISATPRLV